MPSEALSQGLGLVEYGVSPFVCHLSFLSRASSQRLPIYHLHLPSLAPKVSFKAASSEAINVVLCDSSHAQEHVH